MKFFTSKATMNTSRDAMNFAPYYCSAKNEMHNVFFLDIALAVSFLLCLILDISGNLLLSAQHILLKLSKKLYIGQPHAACI